jgi:hypothetical protein
MASVAARVAKHYEKNREAVLARRKQRRAEIKAELAAENAANPPPSPTQLQSQDYYQRNRHKILARYREKRDAAGGVPYVEKLKRDDPRRRLIYGAKNRAKERGIDFDITVEDVVIPELCPVFGTPLVFGGDRNHAPSLDRRDNDLGYVKGNVQVLSWRANCLKRDGTPEEFAKLAAYLNA